MKLFVSIHCGGSPFKKYSNFNWFTFFEQPEWVDLWMENWFNLIWRVGWVDLHDNIIVFFFTSILFFSNYCQPIKLSPMIIFRVSVDDWKWSNSTRLLIYRQIYRIKFMSILISYNFKIVYLLSESFHSPATIVLFVILNL